MRKLFQARREVLVAVNLEGAPLDWLNRNDRLRGGDFVPGAEREHTKPTEISRRSLGIRTTRRKRNWDLREDPGASQLSFCLM